jgi:nucleotide-binding universal stress UspA family protein
VFKHILIATDGSELAMKAVGQGLTLARALGAKATAITVTEAWPSPAPAGSQPGEAERRYEEASVSSAARVLSQVADMARKTGIACETLHVKNRPVADGILETAKATGADVIVMATHGRRGLGRLLIGSEAQKVMAAAQIPVLIHR